MSNYIKNFNNSTNWLRIFYLSFEITKWLDQIIYSIKITIYANLLIKDLSISFQLT